MKTTIHQLRSRNNRIQRDKEQKWAYLKCQLHFQVVIISVSCVHASTQQPESFGVFDALETEMQFHLFGIKDKKVNERLLRMTAPTLVGPVKICRASELALHYLRQIRLVKVLFLLSDCLSHFLANKTKANKAQLLRKHLFFTSHDFCFFTN